MRVLLALLVLLTPSTSCLAADDPWYLAADLGQHQQTGYANADFPSRQVDSTGAYSRLAAGFRVNDYLGVEIGYERLGGEIIGLGTGYTVAFQSKGPVAELVGTLPVGDSWSLFARGGLLRDHLDFSHQILSVTNAPAGPTMEWDHTFGVGATWQWSSSFALRFAVDSVRQVGSSAYPLIGSYDVLTESVGVVYSF